MLWTGEDGGHHPLALLFPRVWFRGSARWVSLERGGDFRGIVGRTMGSGGEQFLTGVGVTRRVLLTSLPGSCCFVIHGEDPLSRFLCTYTCRRTRGLGIGALVRGNGGTPVCAPPWNHGGAALVRRSAEGENGSDA